MARILTVAEMIRETETLRGEIESIILKKRSIRGLLDKAMINHQARLWQENKAVFMKNGTSFEGFVNLAFGL